ncbi:hypothetical protein [Roseibium sediminicola]|uniref:Uncharacterized protein n=1 Tax=Roseibium sediminicola TaxID=2933272 RepID=A0ABT0GN50_9HYPH|nr:hypothetical protein [Roseibium sp. CAU 1639]MCK7610680.1 hypothetical protein [Roseibium sp. CAU 1639]
MVQSALVTALQSREFQSAPQLRAFLGFVVRATLNNEQEKLKGYTIAVEALGRPEDFNPVTDPIVRVEAARLRRRLEKYYSGSGAGDPVRIVIPKGSYAPEFHPACGERAVSPPSESLLAFEEEGSAFEGPSASDLQADADLAGAIARGTALGPPASAPQSGRAASATGPIRDTDIRLSAGRLLHRPVPLSLALLFAGLCFLAGYLAAAS